MTFRARNCLCWITGAVMVLAVLVAIVLMVGQKGLLPGLDFGCGQYYYTDIPNWPTYFSVDAVADVCPHWVYYAVFFLWGYAMYRLWRWLDHF